MISAKSAKKPNTPKRKRTAAVRAPHKTRAASKKETIHLDLTAPDLAQLDGEVARQKGAEPGTPITRTGVLLSFVRSLPSATPRSRRMSSKEGTDTYGRYMDVAVGATSVRFRWVEPGTFTMGSPSSELGRWNNEGPQHKVKLTRGYWMADTPVTQALWEAVMSTNPSRFRGADRPVEMVNWDDAKAFISRLNTMVPGLDARLPTEAEWENACRAGTKTATWAGDIADHLRDPVIDKIAWYYANSSEGTRPVRGKAPNPIGLYDMLGNVYEWCEDWFGAYEAGKVTDPCGPSSGSSRVLRGGCWLGYAGNVRAARRIASVPGDRSGLVGFRLARGQQA